MKQVFGLLIILITAICLAGCSTTSQTAIQGASGTQTQTLDVTSTPSSIPTTVITSAPTTVVTTMTTAPGAQQFKGTGAGVFSVSINSSGDYDFIMQHSGPSDFIVWLNFVDGKTIKGRDRQIAAEKGVYSGTVSSHITEGNYSLMVTASGPWTIEIV